MFERRFQHGTTDSTNERAFTALADGSARHGDVHLAEAQTAGRGRLGRTWISAAGEGLYLSVVLLPAPPPLRPAALTVAAALAVRDALIELGLEHSTLKWPNDLEVLGKKLVGILVETRGLDRDRPHYVVGIGVNVRQRSFPSELVEERPVTSLALEGVDVGTEEVTERLLAQLAQRLDQARDDLDRLSGDFLDATCLAGREVRVRSGRSEHRGRLVGLDLAAGLELEQPDGRRRVPVETVEGVTAL